MFNKVFIALVQISVLTGCASNVAPIVVREPGAFTSITFPLISDEWSEGKVRLALKGKNGCGEFGADILPETTTSDFSGEVDGNHDVFFELTRKEPQGTCSIVGIFYATKGNAYNLNLSMKNNLCEIILSEKNPKGFEQKLKTYPSHLSVTNKTKVCEEKDRLY